MSKKIGLISLSIIASTAVLTAANFTFDGGVSGLGTELSTPSNWSSDTAPTASGDQGLIVSGFDVELNGSFSSAARIRVAQSASGSASLTLNSGSALTLSGGSTSDMVVVANAADGAFTVNGGTHTMRNLLASQTGTSGTGTSTLTFAGGTTTLTGSLGSGDEGNTNIIFSGGDLNAGVVSMLDKTEVLFDFSGSTDAGTLSSAGATNYNGVGWTFDFDNSASSFSHIFLSANSVPNTIAGSEVSFLNLFAGATANIEIVGNDYVVNYTAVPELSSFGLLGGAFALICAVSRRRRLSKHL